MHWHTNTTVWRVISAMNDAGLRQPLTHVLYTYDPPGSPESLNAARMSASRLNATMIDATLLAEAESAGFKPAAAGDAFVTQFRSFSPSFLLPVRSGRSRYRP